MEKKIEQLKLLIEAHKAIERRNGLSELGKYYLSGLKGAYELIVETTGGKGK